MVLVKLLLSDAYMLFLLLCFIPLSIVIALLTIGKQYRKEAIHKCTKPKNEGKEVKSDKEKSNIAIF